MPASSSGSTSPTNAIYHPTVCELAGDSPPSGLRGQSLVPLIVGDDDSFPELRAFAEHRPADKDRSGRKWVKGGVHALQTRDLKLIHRTEAEDSLYDLARDPLEAHNRIEDAALAADRSALEREL
jgi:arylsulfatase A-like enzyme